MNFVFYYLIYSNIACESSIGFFLYYIIMYMYGCFTCDLLMSIKNPVNIWWNEKKLVPLHQEITN